VIDIFRAKGLPVSIAYFERGEAMTEPYIEDDGAEYPINNYVQCGQIEYVASFGEDQAKVLKIKTKACRALKGKFLPKLTEPASK
jgi:hypothetical protein